MDIKASATITSYTDKLIIKSGFHELRKVIVTVLIDSLDKSVTLEGYKNATGNNIEFTGDLHTSGLDSLLLLDDIIGLKIDIILQSISNLKFVVSNKSNRRN